MSFLAADSLLPSGATFRLLTAGSVCAATFAGVIFIGFASALFFFFPSDGQFRWRMRVISILSCCNFGSFVALALTETLPTANLALGIALQVFAAVIFLWASKSTYRRRLSVAYNPDIPEFIVDTGPYRMIRHPFYTSYIIFWLSLVILRPYWVTAILTIALIGFYVNAAVFEERKFSRSPLSARYRDYSNRTGMFLPRISHGSRDVTLKER
jgi:protein-S-isoprenylcysteine O-methyltransferase Ste14